MNPESLEPIAAAVGGGFFAGLLTGWALKKVIKLAAVVVGLFIGTLIYLQSQAVISISWDKLQSVTEVTLATITNSITDTGEISTMVDNIGLPLTGSISAGFAIGFMKG
jgi:uncharacterized membrane protein (Fun14 family)